MQVNIKIFIRNKWWLAQFNSDFMFPLSIVEWETLRCSFSTSKHRGGTRYLPFAFTEQGVSMLSSVLKSDKAINMNISVMRAFVFIRQYALTHKDLTEKLKELGSKYNKQFKDVYEALNYLLQKDKQQQTQSAPKRIGYKLPKRNLIFLNKWWLVPFILYSILVGKN